MALDYSKLSDEELEAIANDDYSKLSDATLKAIANEPVAKQTAPAKEYGLQDVITTAGQMAAPAVSSAVSGPTGAAQLAADIKGAQVFQPLSQSMAGRFGEYISKPAKAVIDAATMLTTGIPGAAPAALYDTYKAAQEAVPRMRQALGAMQLDEKLYSDFANKLSQGELNKFGSLVEKMGGKKAIEAFELPARLANDPAAVQAFNALKSEAAMAPSTTARLAGPLLRGAAKALGPVGIGMDIYEAYPYYQQANVPERTASGQVRQAMTQARQGMLNQPTPAPLSAQEAQNLYQSGDQRLIDIYKQDRELSALMRRKAAERVVGPIAPGQ